MNSGKLRDELLILLEEKMEPGTGLPCLKHALYLYRKYIIYC